MQYHRSHRGSGTTIARRLAAAVSAAILFSMMLLHAAQSAPVPDPGSALTDFWLRFHEADLCQDLDAVFVFRPKAVEIWCVIEDEGSFERLNDLVKPLRANYEVGLYPTRPQAEKKSPEDRNPPPSLWNNEELREYLNDPFLRSINPPDEGRTRDGGFMMKQRMIMYAEQTLDWEKKLRRFAEDLPALARMATDNSSSSETRRRAAAVCLDHAQEVDRYVGRLVDNLSQALPKGSGKTQRDAPESDRPEGAKIAAVESAVQVADSAAVVARRVYRFIHPRMHTVGLVDLKESSLLDALKELRKTTAAFQRAMTSAGS